jgi:hypothetical protein
MNKKSLAVFTLLFITFLIQSQTNDYLLPKITKLKNDWYDVTVSVCIENITPEEATEKAIIKACNCAVEFMNGFEVTGRTSTFSIEDNKNVKLDHFTKLMNKTSYGMILEKEVLVEETTTYGNSIYKTVRVKVRVGKQRGKKDQSFHLEASLNKEYFKEGEEFELTVTSTKDCYLLILNIMSDENVATIFPNDHRTKNFLKANQIFTLPNEKDKLNRIKYEMSLLPGKSDDVEMIKIIASKRPLIFTVNSNYKTALESLYNWLVQIPLNEIEEVDLIYNIYK